MYADEYDDVGDKSANAAAETALAEAISQQFGDWPAQYLAEKHSYFRSGWWNEWDWAAVSAKATANLSAGAKPAPGTATMATPAAGVGKAGNYGKPLRDDNGKRVLLASNEKVTKGILNKNDKNDKSKCTTVGIVCRGISIFTSGAEVTFGIIGLVGAFSTGNVILGIKSSITIIHGGINTYFAIISMVDYVKSNGEKCNATSGCGMLSQAWISQYDQDKSHIELFGDFNDILDGYFSTVLMSSDPTSAGLGTLNILSDCMLFMEPAINKCYDAVNEKIEFYNNK